MIEIGALLSNRYQILEKIGTGGMSDVYKALDTSLGREVALKVLKDEYVTDMDFVSKFRAEAKAAAGLEHPNIVNVYDVGNQDGNYFIVMEYIEGITLKTYISKKGILNYSELLSIAIQVGRGIEAAHNKQIIHRDIKPQNIIISKEGKVKVTDFGIARAVTSNTINADRMGSVHYSSPEQARNGFVTYQSDIYSLGIMMYEMATGKLPFDGDTTVAVAILHLQSEIIPPSQLEPSVPISVEKIILRATMKNPDRRYRDMTEMLTDLKKAMVTPDEDFVFIPPVNNIPSSEDIVTQAGIITPETIGSEDSKDIRFSTDDISTRIRESDKSKESKAEEKKERNPKTAPSKSKIASEIEEQGVYPEDDEDDVKTGLDRAITIMGIAAAIIIILIVVYLLGSFLDIFSVGRKPENNTTSSTSSVVESDPNVTKEVPSVLGMTESNAKKTLESHGFNYKKLGESSSQQYAEGEIMEQSINGGESAAQGTTIEVVVSSGVGDQDVPSVVGLTQADAITQIESKGFICRTEPEYNETVEQGRVIRQTPTDREKAKKYDTITIYVSRGSEQVDVPNVVEKAENIATLELTTAGFSVIVERDTDPIIPKGYVVSQSHSGKAQRGTEITLIVSSGIADEGEYYKTVVTLQPVNNQDTYVVLLDANGDMLYQRVVTEPVSIALEYITTSTGLIRYYSGMDMAYELKAPETLTFTPQ